MNLSPDNRIAGVLVPLFALRGENDLGVGDVSALREFIDWIAGIGFKLVQLLPINETGSDNSPYNAISAMAIEPTTLYLGPDSPEDLTRQDVDFALGEVVPCAAKRADASTPLRTSLSKLRRGGVTYRLVKKLKRRLLEKAFANFSARANPDRRTTFRKCCEEEAAWSHEYVFFRAEMGPELGHPPVSLGSNGREQLRVVAATHPCDPTHFSSLSYRSCSGILSHLRLPVAAAEE